MEGQQDGAICRYNWLHDTEKYGARFDHSGTADGVNGIMMRLIGFYADLILATMAFFAVLFIDFNITIIAISIMIAVLLSYSLFTKFSIEKFGSSSQSFQNRNSIF